MAVSVMMLGTAQPINNLVELIHVAGMNLSQKASTGTQLKITPKKEAIAHPRIQPPIIFATTARSSLGSKVKYSKRIEILVDAIVVRYINSAAKNI